jgi:aquaporin Z
MQAREPAVWPNYLIEACGLGAFMVSACLFASLLEHPGSPIHAAIDNAHSRRLIMGLAMGATAVMIIYSPWGKRSGAHLNPATTLTFARLGRVRPRVAVGYAAAQMVGGALGVFIAWSALRDVVAHPAVHFVVTAPGPWGRTTAFAAEVLIAFILMTAVLHVSNRPGINRYTGLVAGLLVASFITFEAPLSGMSLNPARSFASAIVAADWRDFWIYVVAPPFGMLLAATIYSRARRPVLCAKLHHDNDAPCPFECAYPRLRSSSNRAALTYPAVEANSHSSF